MEKLRDVNYLLSCVNRSAGSCKFYESLKDSDTVASDDEDND